MVNIISKPTKERFTRLGSECGSFFKIKCRISKNPNLSSIITQGKGVEKCFLGNGGKRGWKNIDF